MSTTTNGSRASKRKQKFALMLYFEKTVEELNKMRGWNFDLGNRFENDTVIEISINEDEEKAWWTCEGMNESEECNDWEEILEQMQDIDFDVIEEKDINIYEWSISFSSSEKNPNTAYAATKEEAADFAGVSVDRLHSKKYKKTINRGNCGVILQDNEGNQTSKKYSCENANFFKSYCEENFGNKIVNVYFNDELI